MPESDTYGYASHAEALAALADEMREYADANDDTAYDLFGADAEVSMLAQADAVVRDEIKCGHIDGDFQTYLSDFDDRLISFWVMWSDESDPDEF